MSEGEDSRRRMSDASSCEDDSVVGERGSVPANSASGKHQDQHCERRKDSDSSSDSSSEEGADGVDEDGSTSKSASMSKGEEMGPSAEASEPKTSSSASANVVDNRSSSDTEDDVSIKDDDDDDNVGEGRQTRPVPAARKVSIPPGAEGEMTKDELELSKRETVNLGGDSDSSSEGEDEKQVREKGHSVRVEVDEVSDGELESAKAAEVVAAKVESEPEAKPRTGGGGAEIKRPQFRHSSSSLSDEEVVHDGQSSIKSPSPTSSKVVSEKTQQLFSAGQNESRSATSGSQSPLPTRANANNLTRIYTDAIESNNNNNNNNSIHSAERVKPGKGVTQIYTESIAKAGTTPPASPKPVPSRNKNITQLYTAGFQGGDKSNGVSPCVAADKLSPKKHNMATAIDKDAIRQAYEDVRSDSNDTEWAVFKFEDNKLRLAGTGSSFKNFKSSFSNEDRGFGYIRINTGDEMSKRAKFVFVTWVGPSVSVMKKAKMSTDKALMKDIIQNMSVELQFENHAEFSHDHFKSQVDKAAGARYGTGERAL